MFVEIGNSIWINTDYIIEMRHMPFIESYKLTTTVGEYVVKDKETIERILNGNN